MILKLNPNSNKWILPKGYKDLGWIRPPRSYEEIANCKKRDHIKKWREFDNSLYLASYTDLIFICDECKTVWHVKM